MIEMNIGAVHGHHGRAAAVQPERPEGPGKSAESVGHRARAAVGEARETGADLPRNAMGHAASNMARGCCCDMESLFSAWLENEMQDLGLMPEAEVVEDGVSASDELTETPDVMASDEVAETDEFANVEEDVPMAPEQDDMTDAVAAVADDGEEPGADDELSEDLSQLAEAAREVYDLTTNILERLNVNSLKTALELLDGGTDEEA